MPPRCIEDDAHLSSALAELPPEDRRLYSICDGRRGGPRADRVQAAGLADCRPGRLAYRRVLRRSVGSCPRHGRRDVPDAVARPAVHGGSLVRRRARRRRNPERPTRRARPTRPAGRLPDFVPRLDRLRHFRLRRPHLAHPVRLRSRHREPAVATSSRTRCLGDHDVQRPGPVGLVAARSPVLAKPWPGRHRDHGRAGRLRGVHPVRPPGRRSMGRNAHRPCCRPDPVTALCHGTRRLGPASNHGVRI